MANPYLDSYRNKGTSTQDTSTPTSNSLLSKYRETNPLAQFEAEKKKQQELKKQVDIKNQESQGKQDFLGGIAKVVGDFAAGANEKVLGGATKAAVKAFNTVATGFNQDEANKRTDAFLKGTKQVNSSGQSPLASGKGVDRNSTAFQTGSASGDTIKSLTVDLPGDAYKSARNAVQQAQISTQINSKGAVVGQQEADKLKKFVDEDFKAGKLTKAQADAKKSKLQSEADKTKTATKEVEKKVGAKADQSSGVVSLLETAANLTGLEGIGKTVLTKVAEAASSRLGRDLTVDEMKNLAKQTKNTIDKHVRSDAMQGFSKDNPATSSLIPDSSPEQFKGTFLNPQKVEVSGTPVSTDIGVTTPVKAGVKSTSSESSVEVRTPKVLTEQEYKSQFKKISDSYDKAQKSLEGMPPLKQQAATKAIEDSHAKALAELDDAFANPKLPEGTSKVKQVGRTKTDMTDTSGGTPKGFANTTGEMNDLEKTLFTSAKNRAEGRLGRPLNQQETSKIYDRTKVLAEEKGFNTPNQSSASTEDVGRARPSGTAVDKVTSEELPAASKPEVSKSTYEENTDGELKTSGNAARIEQRSLEKKLTEKMGDLPQYKSIDMKEQAKEAVDLINTDRQKAIDIIEGKANAPGNLKAQSVHQALEDLAVREGDGELLTKLAKSHVNTELSESAQNLRIAAERDPHSAVEQIRQIKDARVKAAEKRSKTTVSKATTDIKKKVEAATPKATKQDWNSFVKELTC